MGPRPGGSIVARNVPLRLLIGFAYGLRGYEIAGGPDWMSTVRFDLEAKADGNPPLDQLRTMLQTLLADRFQLTGHRETRQLDGFALVNARPDRLGSNLRPATIDCRTSFSTETRCTQGGTSIGALTSFGMPVSNLTGVLMSELSDPVIDNTQLSGTFDVEPGIQTRTAELLVVDHAEHPTPN